MPTCLGLLGLEVKEFIYINIFGVIASEEGFFFAHILIKYK